MQRTIAADVLIDKAMNSTKNKIKWDLLLHLGFLIRFFF